MVDIPEDFRFKTAGTDGIELSEGDAFSAQAEYRLIRSLGTGGMGEVWHAHRISAGGHFNDVALKFLLLPDEEAEKGLAQEALRISELRHDNIVGFVDSGKATRGSYFVAMEFVRGIDLDGLLALHGLGPERVAVAEGMWRIPCPLVGFVLFMVCRALHHAHTRVFRSGEVGLIHRDISPGNVLIEEENGFVKLSDFGVAASASAASGDAGFTGKIPYAAPEVLYQEPVDVRADIYSLGLVAYELMTGLNPNRALVPGDNPMAQLSHVLVSLDDTVVPPKRVVEGADPDLGRVVMTMLARDPAERYQTVDHLMGDLRVALFSRGIGPTTDSFAHYLRLVRDSSLELDDHMRASLVFLCDPGAREPHLRVPWKLTQWARERIEQGENPARRPQDG
jgi:serine/threonine-protein kinase